MTEEGEEDGKLPSVDHGRRTDRGRDKTVLMNLFKSNCKAKKWRQT
jgi:hypothetical protein